MHRVLRLIAILLASAAALVVAVASAAADGGSRLDDILARGVLRVGTTGDYKPFTYRDTANGTYEGFDIDMANELAAALGVKIEFVGTSWPTLMKDFQAGAFDIGMGGISVTLERAKTAYFSSPYLRDGKTPIARCANSAKFATLGEIDKPGVRVIANPGGTNEKFDRANLKAAEIVIFPDNTRIFDEIVAGHADLMITDGLETRYQAKVHPELCPIHPDQPFDFAEKAYLLPRDMPLAAFVDTWLRINRESGRFGKTYARYFGG